MNLFICKEHIEYEAANHNDVFFDNLKTIVKNIISKEKTINIIIYAENVHRGLEVYKQLASTESFLEFINQICN